MNENEIKKEISYKKIDNNLISIGDLKTEEIIQEEKPENYEKPKYFFISRKPINLLALLFKFISFSDCFLVAFAIIFSLVSGISTPLFIFLLGDAITKFETLKTSQSLKIFISDMISKFLLIGSGIMIASFISTFLWTYTSFKSLMNIKKQYFRNIIKQEQGWFDRNNPYQFSSIIHSQIKTIESGIGEKIGNILFSISTFILGMIFAFISSWKLSLVLLSVTPIITVILILITKFIRESAKKTANSYFQIGGFAEEILYKIKTFFTFSNYEHEYIKFDELIKTTKKLAIKSGVMSALANALIMFFYFMIYAIAIGYGSLLIYNKEENTFNDQSLTGGDILKTILSVIVSGIGLGYIFPNIRSISEAKVAASDLNELGKRKVLFDLSKSLLKPNKDDIIGKIEFKNVDFSFPKNPNIKVLNNISLVFEPCKKTAIVGESGSGKSSLIHLIERLYDTDSGEILIDGINIKEFDLPTLRNFLGYVHQEPVLFNQTIRENLIFGREHITEDMIKKTCDKAHASEFIEKYKEKYEYNVGIKGKNLSGGEKQKLAIARALLLNPKILILDEPTSVLDNKIEQEIFKTLDEISKSTSIIVVAHLLHTIVDFDKILVMKNGVIIETGSHKDLMELNGYYSNLYKHQLILEKNNFYFQDYDSISGSREVSRVYDDFYSQKSIVSKENMINSYRRESDISNKLIDIPNIDRLYNGNLGEKLVNNRSKYTIESANIKKKDLQEENILINKKIKDIKLSDFFSNKKLLLTLACLNGVLNALIFPFFGMLFAISIDSLSGKDFIKIKNDGFFNSMMFIFMAVVSSIVIFLQNYFISKIGENFTFDLLSEIFKKYLRMDCAFFDLPENSPGALIHKLNSYTLKAKSYVLSLIFVFFPGSINFLIRIILGMLFDWRIGLIASACIPLLIFSSILQNKIKQGLIRTDDLLDSEANIMLSEAVINTKTIFSFNKQDYVVKIYEDLINISQKTLIKKSTVNGIIHGFSHFIIYITYSVLFYVGGLFIIEGSLTFGKMLRSIFSLIFATSGLSQTQQYIGEFLKGKNAFLKIIKILEISSEIDPLGEENKIKRDASKIKGKIEFKDVTFHYPSRPETKILDKISFVIEPGQIVAFTGFSGSGKSTIIRLLERFYDCQSGDILIDDLNIKEYNLISLRKQIGIVVQESTIFKRTLFENIEYGKLGSTLEEIKNSAKEANLEEFFTDNFNIKCKCEHFSQGQKQKISFARAILKNPKILLLDKATVGLDKISSIEIQKIVFTSSKNRTTIIISDRIPILERCEKVYLLHKGKIEEIGTNDDLMRMKGLYYELYNLNN